MHAYIPVHFCTDICSWNHCKWNMEYFCNPKSSVWPFKASTTSSLQLKVISNLLSLKARFIWFSPCFIHHHALKFSYVVVCINNYILLFVNKFIHSIKKPYFAYSFTFCFGLVVSNFWLKHFLIIMHMVVTVI